MSHDWDALRRVASDDRSPVALGHLTPWLCEYRGADGLYSITLYGADPQQVWTDNAESLPGLKIIGVLHGSGKA